jgi:hypothetical protein
MDPAGTLARRACHPAPTMVHRCRRSDRLLPTSTLALVCMYAGPLRTPLRRFGNLDFKSSRVDCCTGRAIFKSARRTYSLLQ